MFAPDVEEFRLDLVERGRLLEGDRWSVDWRPAGAVLDAAFVRRCFRWMSPWDDEQVVQAIQATGLELGLAMRRGVDL